MHFSRIRLATQNLGIKQYKELAQGNAYNAHQLLWQLFPEKDSRTFLFRQEIDKSISNSLPLYYVLSDIQPTTDSDLFVIETKSYSPALLSGQLFNFSLRANPVVTKFRGKDLNPAHHDVLMDIKLKAKKNNTKISWQNMEQAAIEWLKKRSIKAGFSFDDKKVVTDFYQQHSFYKKNQKVPIRFSSIDFNGVLSVEDPELFKNALFNGLGRAKAFGCGLMLIRPHAS